jgi:hypothetical protein
MSKPDLKQIKQDMEDGKIVSKCTWADVIAYAVELENERQALLKMTTPYIPGPHQVNSTLTSTGLEFLR